MSEWLIRFLILLCPADFRDAYGSDMVRLFRDRCRREGWLRVALETIPDLLMTAAKEHMDTLLNDIRYSLRSMRKSLGFTATAVLTIALGIGANTAIFSVVKGVLLEPFPYRDPDRIVQLYEKRMHQGRVRNPVSAPDFADWQKQSTVFESMSALSGAAYSLTENGPAEFIRGGEVSVNFFGMLGVRPMLGRDFVSGEDQQGKDRVVILSHALWQRRFGSDPNIPGRNIVLSGNAYTVIGVLPPMEHVIRGQMELWKPFVVLANMPRAAHFLDVYARLKPGVSVDQARAEMETIASRLEQQYSAENTGHRINLFPLREEVTGGVERALIILMGAVALMLLVACANVANFALARAIGRRREISIRSALGAGTTRIIRQLLTESIVLSTISGVAGVALAYWLVKALAVANPGNLPRLQSIQVDSLVLLFALAVSLFTGVVIGLAPSLYATKSRLSETLKEGGRASTYHAGGARVRRTLVTAEVALALLLSIGAGLMLQSFVRLTAVSPGFDPHNILAIDIGLTGQRYGDPQARRAFFHDLMNRLRAQPGVTSAGATIALPFSGSDGGTNFLIEGNTGLPYAQQPNARIRVVSSGYFETIRIPLRTGRFIGNTDSENVPPVAVINETMARQFWPDESAIGKRITLSGERKWREIVGIVGDVKHYSLNGETRPELYLPTTQEPVHALTVIARTTFAPERLIATVRHEVAQIDKDQPIARIRTLDELLSRSVAQPRLYSGALTVFSTVALLLAAIGIYAVMSFIVSQRTHEIGVRMALGAPAGEVRLMVLRQGLTLTAIGVLLGVGGALALTRLLRSLLFGIEATDLSTFAGSALLLAIVAAAASYLPARRATRVDPILALRCD